MCSRGGGKSIVINGLKHKCSLCDHSEALKEIDRLEMAIDDAIKNIHPYIKSQSKGKYIVPAILWSAQCGIKELRELRGEG